MTSMQKAGLFLLAPIGCALLLGAAPVSPQLNPRVTKSAQQHGVALADCNESLAPAPAPRVDVAEIPMPVRPVSLDLTPPPSGDLRSTLRDTQQALRRNDRPEFDINLARAKSLLADYPSGAERRAGEELIRIYDDAARVWDAQFDAPFFDETSSTYSRLSAYPGWREAVQRGILNDDREHRFYPAAESRTFLASIAADRLSRIGIRTPAPATQTRMASRETASTSRAASSTSRAPQSTSRSTQSTPRSTSSTQSTSSSRSRRTQVADAQPRRSRTPSEHHATPTTHTTTSRPAARRSTTTASAAPSTTSTPSSAASKPATTNTPPMTSSSASAPASTPASVPSSEPAPVPTLPASTTVAPPSTDSATTTALATATASPVTASEAAAETVATNTTPIVPETPQRTRSVVLPTILILIGLGVLIVLFRASK